METSTPRDPGPPPPPVTGTPRQLCAGQGSGAGSRKGVWDQHSPPNPAVCPTQVLPQLRTTVRQRRGPARPGVKSSLPTQPGAPGPWAPPSLTAHLPPITSTRHLGTSPFSCFSPGSLQEWGGQRKRSHDVCLLSGDSKGQQRRGRPESAPAVLCPGVPEQCPCQVSTLPELTGPTCLKRPDT